MLGLQHGAVIDAADLRDPPIDRTAELLSTTFNRPCAIDQLSGKEFVKSFVVCWLWMPGFFQRHCKQLAEDFNDGRYKAAFDTGKSKDDS